MFKSKKLLALVLTVILTFALAGCNYQETNTEKNTSNEQTEDAATGETESTDPVSTTSTTVASVVTSANVTVAEGEVAEGNDTTQITLSGDSISMDGSGATAKGSTLTITEAGSYILSGKLTDGQIVIAATKNDAVQLILNGVDIYCSTTAPIYCSQADKLTITLVKGSVNKVSDGSSYVLASGEDEPNAAIFSMDDLIIEGSGTVNLTANYNNGIASKDDLVIKEGTMIVNAKNDALRGRDSVEITGGNFTLVAGGDGIQSNNDEDATKGFINISGGTFTITSTGDGIQAETTLAISGGIFKITSGGGATKTASDSSKGLKATGDLTVSGGTFNINSADDGLHSNANITIEKGTITIASADDGMHTDADLTINGGTLTISKSYEGIEGANVIINAGDISIVASDDGINSAGGSDTGMDSRPGRNSFVDGGSYNVTLNGGTINIDASGDGIDSNGNLDITGGTILVSGPTNDGNGVLDYQNSCSISGGILVAVGSTGMAEAPGSNSSQNSFILSLASSQAAGSTIKLCDASGNVLVSYTPAKTYQSVVVSTPELAIGSTYTLYVNNKVGTSITLTSVVTGNSGGGFGGGGGMQPGGQGGQKR